MSLAENVPPPPSVFGPGPAFACFLAYLGSQFVVGIAVAVPFASREAPVWLLPVMALVSMVVSAAVLYVCVRSLLGGPLRERGREKFGLRASSLPRNAGAALAGAGLAALSLAVAPILVPPPETGGPLQEMAEASDLGLLVLLVLALVVAPPIEEFLFRGVMYHGLSRRLAPWLAALIVTAIFVALHVYENRNYWPALVSITLLAVLLIALRIRFVSLAPALVAHFAFNAVMTAVAVATRG
ncbi:MAG: lysostaphin resistance A-like protein [Planctomycetota bacterium]